MADAIFVEQPLQQGEWRFIAGHTIEMGHTICHAQCLLRVHGEERIAAQVFMALHAFQKRQGPGPFQPPRHGKGFRIDDLADKRGWAGLASGHGALI